MTGVAAKLFMMDFQIRHRATRLTSPSVATQDLLTESFVGNRIQPQARGFWANRTHNVFSLKLPRNVCLCSPGRNLKNLVIENRSVSGSLLSRLPLARKSEQIISGQ